MPSQNKSSLQHYIYYTGLSTQMVLLMGLSAWLGIKLDHYWELHFPWFLSLFSIGATILSIYLTIKKLMRKLKDDKL